MNSSQLKLWSCGKKIKMRKVANMNYEIFSSDYESMHAGLYNDEMVVPLILIER
jgi:hypothetical protein